MNKIINFLIPTLFLAFISLSTIMIVNHTNEDNDIAIKKYEQINKKVNKISNLSINASVYDYYNHITLNFLNENHIDSIIVEKTELFNENNCRKVAILKDNFSTLSIHDIHDMSLENFVYHFNVYSKNKVEYFYLLLIKPYYINEFLKSKKDFKIFEYTTYNNTNSFLILSKTNQINFINILGNNVVITNSDETLLINNNSVNITLFSNINHISFIKVNNKAYKFIK
jgi:hypothetical protein